MGKQDVLIIGAGGVAEVTAHKCAQNNDILGSIHIASRTLSKCEAIIKSIHEKGNSKVEGVYRAHSIDASNSESVEQLIKELGVDIVINAGATFINMSVLDACIRAKVAYIDTSIHEDPMKVCETPPWYANYEWKRSDACRDGGVTAVLGAGFDPGVVNAYAALAVQDYFDEVESIDIIDINGGDHGKYFATNFDPEVNFREFTGTVYSWQDSAWKANSMFEIPMKKEFPEVGERTVYLTGHDEIHSLSKNLDVPNIRFWMSFGDHYINVFTVLKNLGLLSEKPVKTAEGLEVVPLKVVKAVLPDPTSLAEGYSGKTCIGNEVRGYFKGQKRELFIYNVSDHALCNKEVGSQAISYTAGVPAAAAAILIAKGIWDVGCMANVEELPPHPFLAEIARMGLPTRIRDEQGDRELFS